MSEKRWEVTRINVSEHLKRMLAEATNDRRTTIDVVSLEEAGIEISADRRRLGQPGSYLYYRPEGRTVRQWQDCKTVECYHHLSLMQETGQIAMMVGQEAGNTIYYLAVGYDSGHQRALCAPPIQGNNQKLAAWKADAVAGAIALSAFLDDAWCHERTIAFCDGIIRKDGGRHTYEVASDGTSYGYNRARVCSGADSVIAAAIEELMNGVPEARRRPICAVTETVLHDVLWNGWGNGHVPELAGLAMSAVRQFERG